MPILCSNSLRLWLSDNDIIRSFAQMVRQKLQTCNQLRESWPMSIDDVENFVQRGPLPELYNAIYATINPSFKVHSTGYAVTPSHQSATKIWSVASDWEYLVTKKKKRKQVLQVAFSIWISHRSNCFSFSYFYFSCFFFSLGMVAHWLTGNKEVVYALHKLNHSISYVDVRMQNKKFT